MDTEYIRIGCKTPHGLVLELGLVMDENKNVIRGPDYEVKVLQGMLGAVKGAKFGTTRVRKALWDKWLAKNKSLRYVKDGSVFAIP